MPTTGVNTISAPIMANCTVRDKPRNQLLMDVNADEMLVPKDPMSFSFRCCLHHSSAGLGSFHTTHKIKTSRQLLEGVYPGGLVKEYSLHIYLLLPTHIFSPIFRPYGFISI